MTKDIMDLPIILRNVQSGRGYVTTMGHFLGEKAQFLTTSELGQLYRLGNEVIPLTVGGKLITVERQHKQDVPALSVLVAGGGKVAECHDLGHGWVAKFDQHPDRALALVHAFTGQCIELPQASLDRLRAIFEAAEAGKAVA